MSALRAGKGTIYEGGIRVCACVNWAGHIPAGKARELRTRFDAAMKNAVPSGDGPGQNTPP